MEFKQIEAFVNVMKYKSFSKAADASFLTQPTISTHISSLEKELGVTLIDRMGKESRPTKEGRAFYPYAINLLNTRKKALQTVSELHNQIEGVLDLRASTIPGQYILPPLISGFGAEYPNVRFYLEQSDSRIVWNDILEGNGELGFTGDYQNNSLGYDILFKDTAILITPKNEKFLALREKTDAINMEDYLEEPFVWREGGSATRRTFEEMIQNKKRGARLKIAATMNNLETIKRCVAGGLGVSIVSNVVTATDGERADYLSFQLADIRLEREFYMIYNRNITLSPAATRFREFILNSVR